MNILTITGRVGKDAELRKTQKGTSVLGFSVANDVGFGDNKTTQWIDCSVFGERADKLAQYVTKGTGLALSGEASLNVYTKGDGSPGGSIRLNVQSLDFMGGKSEQQQQSPAPAADPFDDTPPPDLDDSVPF